MLPGHPGGGNLATDKAKSIRRVGVAQGCHTLLLYQPATSAQKELQCATSAQKEARWATLAQKRAYDLPPPRSCPGEGEVKASA